METKQTEEPKKEPEKEDKPKSPIEKAVDKIKELDEREKRLDEKMTRLEEMEANALMSGTAGGHIESMKTPAEKEDAKAQAMADEITGAFE